MSDDTYSVSLTFNQWMQVTTALGMAAEMYEQKDMEGQANVYSTITDDIAESLKNE